MIDAVTKAMVSYYAGDPRRVQHFLKVHAFAAFMGRAEGLKDTEQAILEIAALVHDIGIKNSEKKFASTSGAHQEKEGPPEAEKLLRGLGLGEGAIGRVCWLVGRHHTYTNITGTDYQILVEADFLVNIFEDSLPGSAVKSIREKIFKTNSGIFMLETMYPA